MNSAVRVGLYTMLFRIGVLLVISSVFVFISLACTSDVCLQSLSTLMSDCLLFWFKHNFLEHTAVNFTSKTLAGQRKKLKLVSSIAQQSVCFFVFCLFVVWFSLVFVCFCFVFVCSFVCCCFEKLRNCLVFVVVVVSWLPLQPAENSDDIVD